MTSDVDLAVVGTGAAGLATAIFTAQAAPSGTRIALFDGARTLGAKILVSGGGRCNVTHQAVAPADYNGSPNIVRKILAAFGVRDTIAWFESMGVSLKTEPTGKLFPVANSSRAVLGALLDRCQRLGIRIKTDCRITEITPPSDDGQPFILHHLDGPTKASRVALTTGGRSLPRSGSDGCGWNLARAMGHTITPTYAALVPLVLDPQFFHPRLSGISHEAELSTFVEQTRLDQRAGSLLWTHFGLSGPVVMDASRHWVIAHETGQKPVLRCNFFPGHDFPKVEHLLLDAIAQRPRATILAQLARHLPERLAGLLLEHLQLNPATPGAQLSREHRRQLVHTLTGLALPVTGHRGWNYAEVTAGGIPLNQINPRTMQSRQRPGLYLAGEILDCDGRIGGFNFQWAWATAHVAGVALAASMQPAPA